ncbi:MAG: hypothetical protein P4K98_04235 [Bryobacteraceae bacterium]|nr:hypothetical protein [Bryobacteraceae bacterium]
MKTKEDALAYLRELQQIADENRDRWTAACGSMEELQTLEGTLLRIRNAVSEAEAKNLAATDAEFGSLIEKGNSILARVAQAIQSNASMVDILNSLAGGIQVASLLLSKLV